MALEMMNGVLRFAIYVYISALDNLSNLVRLSSNQPLSNQKKRCRYLMLIERYFLSILHKNICCRCSLESPWRGDSNEH